MTEDNVMEFCQWLVSEKGIEAGNLSDYINNNEEEVLKLAQEFKKPKFKVGGKVEAAAEMFKCGGKTEEKQDGGKMKRRDVKSAAKENWGYNNSQFNDAYLNLKSAYRSKGMSRKDAKLKAQEIIANGPQEKVVVNKMESISPNAKISVTYSDAKSPIRLPENKAIIPNLSNVEGLEPMIRYSMTPKKDAPVNRVKISPITPKYNNTNVVMAIPALGDQGYMIDDVVVRPNKRTNFDNIKDFFKNIRFAMPKFDLGGELDQLPRREGSRIVLKEDLNDRRNYYRELTNDGYILETIDNRFRNGKEILSPDSRMTFRLISPDLRDTTITSKDGGIYYDLYDSKNPTSRGRANAAKFNPIFESFNKK